MRKALIFVLLGIIFFTGCEKEEESDNKLIGTWKYVKVYDPMIGYYYIDTESQIFIEYTKRERITYDYQQNQIGRCNYSSTKSIIEIYGKNLDGSEWRNDYEYWFIGDTLKIRIDGGFEYYDNFFIKVE